MIGHYSLATDEVSFFLPEARQTETRWKAYISEAMIDITAPIMNPGLYDPYSVRRNAVRKRGARVSCYVRKKMLDLVLFSPEKNTSSLSYYMSSTLFYTPNRTFSNFMSVFPRVSCTQHFVHI